MVRNIAIAIALLVLCMCTSANAIRAARLTRLRQHVRVGVGNAAAAARATVRTAKFAVRAAPPVWMGAVRGVHVQPRRAVVQQPQAFAQPVAQYAAGLKLPAAANNMPAADQQVILGNVMAQIAVEAIHNLVDQQAPPAQPTPEQMAAQANALLVPHLKQAAAATKDTKEKALEETAAKNPPAASFWSWLTSFYPKAVTGGGDKKGGVKKITDPKELCPKAFSGAGMGGIVAGKATIKGFTKGQKLYRIHNCDTPPEQGSWWSSVDPTSAYADNCEAAKKLGMLNLWGAKLDCVAEATLNENLDMCVGPGETVNKAVEAKKEPYQYKKFDEAVAKMPAKDLVDQTYWYAQQGQAVFKKHTVKAGWAKSLEDCIKALK